jgi:hypothetical protein
MLSYIVNILLMSPLSYHFGVFYTYFHFITDAIYGVYFQETDLLKRFGELLGENWFQGLFSVVAIIVTIVVYMHEQTKLRKETIIRSCEAILREIEENVESLTGGEYERIVYSAGKESDSIEDQRVNYTNAYLDIDAYESILFSGSFTHFASATQRTLTMLYGRIRKRNELITYAEHFEDTFFMNSHNHSETEKKEKWFKTVTKYDILITRSENEIRRLIEEAKDAVELL